MNYKKPAFRIVILAVIACVVVAVCFLTDPSNDSDNTMPLFGMSYEVSEVIYKNESVVESGLYDTVDPLGIQEILLDERGRFFILKDGNTAVNVIGILEEVTLTKQNFDNYFDYEDLPSKLRRRSDNAYLCIHTHEDLGPLMYYALETPESEKFLACGWWDSEGRTDPYSDDSSFYWVVALEERMPVVDVQQTTLNVKNGSTIWIPRMKCSGMVALKSIFLSIRA